MWETSPHTLELVTRMGMRTGTGGGHGCPSWGRQVLQAPHHQIHRPLDSLLQLPWGQALAWKWSCRHLWLNSIHPDIRSGRDVGDHEPEDLTGLFPRPHGDTGLSPMSVLRTARVLTLSRLKTAKQAHYKILHYLAPIPTYSLPSLVSLITTSLPQGLCTSCSLCLDPSSSR
uniref:Uncharacterized protein n=1 Tax=Mustela putorius furo TaxID=9669 RepID=M3YRW7_MUSPF